MSVVICNWVLPWVYECLHILLNFDWPDKSRPIRRRCRHIWLSVAVACWVPSNATECCYELISTVCYERMLLWAHEIRPLWLNFVVSLWWSSFMTEFCCALMMVVLYDWMLLWNQRAVFLTECCEQMRAALYDWMLLFDLRLNKRLNKQSWGWWLETLPCPLWRHCNGWGPSVMSECYLRGPTLVAEYCYDWMPLWPAVGRPPFWLKVVVCCWCCHELMRAAPYDWVHLLSDK